MLVKVFLIYGLSRKNKAPSNSMFEGGRLSLQFISKSLESDTDFLVVVKIEVIESATV